MNGWIFGIERKVPIQGASSKVCLDLYLVAKVMLCDHQKGRERKIIGSEGGFASAFHPTVSTLKRCDSFEPDRLIGAIAVTGPVREICSNPFVAADSVRLAFRTGQANV